MPWYKSGTVSCTQNSTTVTGTSTAFAANARVGDAFMGPDGRWYEVVNVASDTVLSIQPGYIGATVSAGTYALAPMQGYVKDSADALRTLVNKFGDLASSPVLANLLTMFSTDGKLQGALNLASPVSLASAATVAIGAAAANTINITGTTTITAFDTIAAGARRTLIFAGSLVIANSSKISLLGGTGVTTGPGDIANFESLGSGNWKCTGYFRAGTRSQQSCSLSVSAVQSIPTGAYTDLTFDTEAFDSAGMHAGSDAGVTVPTSGVYLVLACVAYTATAAARYGIRLVQNGALVAGSVDLRPAVSGGTIPVSISKAVVCTAGDVIKAQAYQDSGSAVSTNAGLTSLAVLKLFDY